MAKQTFAQRAKAIQNKYPRASYDRYEKEALEQEMSSLAKEQEVYKQENGIQGEQSNKMKVGGFLKFKKDSSVTPKEDEVYSDIKADYKPLAISTATGILGNLALERRNKERMKETYNVVPVVPKLMDLSEERRGIEAAKSKATSTMQNRVKTAARTRGELLENQNTGQAELEANYNDAMRKSYAGEQNANVDIVNRAGLYNSQLLSNLNANRHADRRALQGEQDIYRSSALGIVGQAAKQYDVLKMSADDMNAIGDHYKIAVNPKTGKRERVYYNKETGKRVEDK